MGENIISLGQLNGSVLSYKDGNGETVEIKFDGSNCDNNLDEEKSINIPNK